MIVKWLLATLLSKVFGEGFGADLAGRGVVYLTDGVRKALDRDEIPVTTAKLTPGATYTVIARPPATRRERRLAQRRAALDKSFRSASRPDRKQLRVARKLARTQKRLGRAKPSTGRFQRLAARERRLGDRFDSVMRPTRRELRLARELTEVTAQLDAERAANLERARRKGGRRRTRVQFYD